MVIRVIIEGGSLTPKVSSEIMTVDGSEVLREELQKFFTSVLGISNIKMIVNYAGGNKNAVQTFVEASDDHYLYTDLDDIPENREMWFSKMSDNKIAIPETKKQKIYFWIQEMESWFLKQPECIERWAAKNNVKVIGSIPSDKLIDGKDIEHLQHKASYVMSVLFNRHLKYQNTNTKRKIKYGKLRHAPKIIPHLNPQDLLQKDTELQSFIANVKAFYTQHS